MGDSLILAYNGRKPGSMNRPLCAAVAVSALLLATSCGEKTLTLEGYEKNLASAGVTTGPKEPQSAPLIGAKRGYGFSLKGDRNCTEENLCRCEIYEFDTSIKSGRDALATIKKEGLMGTRLEFNRNLGIFCQGGSPQGKQAESVLMKMQ